MRRWLTLALLAAVGCASASPPPGGPEDKTPPVLLRTTPDTNNVNVAAENASFYFDELINDRGTGPQEVDAFFLVSPSDGAPRVSWHRSRIDVRPRHGFRPNTAYVITLLPGLTDLRNNKMKAGSTLVFSTGPTIPKDRITGVAFDWVAERPAPLAYIEAITPDSIRYLAQADSVGAFTLGPLPPGTYLVRGIIDANANRALDRTEFYDTLRVTVPLAGPIELLAAQRDTLPARYDVATTDSVTLTLTFDRVLDPAQPLSTSQFRLVGPDSAELAIARVATARDIRIADSLATIAKADSVRRADSLAGRPLSPRRTTPAPAVTRAPGARPTVAPPKPSRPPPFTVLTLTLARPLPRSSAFRLTVTGIRSLGGFTQPLTRSFTTPKPAPPRPPADSAAARRDSVQARPPAPRAPGQR